MSKETKATKGAKGTQGIDVIVTADDGQLDHMDELADKLRGAGMTVSNVLEFTGQVVGRWPEQDTGPLRKLKGVASVDVSRQVRIAPPEEDVQ